MYEVLLLHREKTRELNKQETQTFGINLFLKHCQNCSDVINPTEDIANSLFGEVCGGRSSGNESTSSYSSGWKPYLQPPNNVLPPESDCCFLHNDDVLNALDVPPPTKKFSMDWKVQIDAKYLPDNKTELKLCRK